MLPFKKQLDFRHNNKINENEQLKNIDKNEFFISGFFGIASLYWKPGLENILIELDGIINQTIRAVMKSIELLIYHILNFFKKIYR